jgi:WD40 repeat protein
MDNAASRRGRVESSTASARPTAAADRATSVALLLVALTAAATFFLSAVFGSRTRGITGVGRSGHGRGRRRRAGATATALEAYDKSTTPAAQRALRTSLGEPTRGVLRSHGRSHRWSFSPDGTRRDLGLDGTARLWDANSGAEVAVLSGHVGPVNTWISLDGTRVVTTGADRTIRVWDATTGDQVASCPRRHHGYFARRRS